MQEVNNIDTKNIDGQGGSFRHFSQVFQMWVRLDI